MPPIALWIPLPYNADTLPIMSVTQDWHYPIVAMIKDQNFLCTNWKTGAQFYEHVIQVVVDPPLIHFVAVLCRHIDREWIAQTICSRIWTRVCAAFARVCTTGDLGTPVWFSRSVRRITFFTVLYCSLGIAWLLATRSNQFETLV